VTFLQFQPLKDIAVVAGQTARFECIVQYDPQNVYWAKNGVPIENSYKHQIEYRNGVCRCTIPQATKGEQNYWVGKSSKIDLKKIS
jgi:Immunoglobulin I-set domain